MAKTHFCNKCRLFFNNKSNLNAHNRSRHNESESIDGYQCPNCELVYKEKRNLKAHFLKHHPEESWDTAVTRVTRTPIPNKCK